jgi:signal transduction histidine kinase
MPENLARELASLRHGDHVCLPYDSNDDRDQVIIPFIAEGLARGERVAYVLEADQHARLLQSLSDAGVNASRAVDRGALWLRTTAETYLRSGKFDADDSLSMVEELITRAVADGYTGLRGSGEINVAASADIPWDTVFSYEARVNEWFAKRPLVALCRYHRPDFSPAVIHDVLRTHPMAIVNDRMCRNPYYEKPDVALAADVEAARVEWMLCQLRWSHMTELRVREMTRSLADQTARLAADNQSRSRLDQELRCAVRMRDRLLDVLAKELAIPVAALTMELQVLADAPRGAGEARGAADRARDDRAAQLGALGRHLKRLGILVDELREVSQLTNRQAPPQLDEVDLGDVARQVTMRQRERLAAAGCALVFRATTRIQGKWDRRRIEQMLTNLVINAARRGPGQPVEIELSADADSAFLRVQHRGAPLPPAEEQRLEETMFDQAWAQKWDTGQTPRMRLGDVGLWVSREIAGALGGSMLVSEVAATATTTAAAATTTTTTATMTTATVFTVELPRSRRA